MADKSETVSKSSKVSCQQPSEVDKITNVIDQEIEKILSKNVNCSEEQKERCRTRFKEVHHTAITENLLENGKGSSKKDSASRNHYEPLDASLNKEMQLLLPSLDQEMIKTTKKRKKHPPKICEFLKHQQKSEIVYLQKHKYIVETSLLPSESGPSCHLPSAGEMETAAQDLYQLTNIMPQVDKLENLNNAQKMLSEMTTKTDAEITSSKSDEQSVPLVKRLRSAEITSSKSDEQSVPLVKRLRSSKLGDSASVYLGTSHSSEGVKPNIKVYKKKGHTPVNNKTKKTSSETPQGQQTHRRSVRLPQSEKAKS